MNKLKEFKINQDARFDVYGLMKHVFGYEAYLDTNFRNKSDLTRFRFSIHWLPIERLWYCKPKIDREKRKCTLCKAEYHALMERSHPKICSNALMECFHPKLLQPHKLSEISTKNKYLSSCYQANNASCHLLVNGYPRLTTV